MAQLLIRNLEESLKAQLKLRAKGHGHSMAEEVRTILRKALAAEEEPAGLGTTISRLFERIGLQHPIAEVPRMKPRAAKFEGR